MDEISTRINQNSTVEQPICTNCFKSLGVSSCMKMYQYIMEHGQSTVKTLTSVAKLTQPTVSYHLKEMKQNGILLSQKNGKEVLYRINPLCSVYKEDCVLANIKFPGR